MPKNSVLLFLCDCVFPALGIMKEIITVMVLIGGKFAVELLQDGNYAGGHDNQDEDDDKVRLDLPCSVVPGVPPWVCLFVLQIGTLPSFFPSLSNLLFSLLALKTESHVTPKSGPELLIFYLLTVRITDVGMIYEGIEFEVNQMALVLQRLLWSQLRKGKYMRMWSN